MNTLTMDNLFSELPPSSEAEAFLELLSKPGFEIQRIVSYGDASSPGFWYDPPNGEWILLLRGEARIRFEDEAEPLAMKPGDYVDIAPHRRHRIDWTDPSVPTVWLAVHYGPTVGT